MDDKETNDNLIIDNQNYKNPETSKEIFPMLGNTKVEELQEEMEIGPINDIDSDLEPIGKKEMNTLLTNLNSYWVEILASLGLFIFIIIYEIIGFIILLFLKSLYEFRIDMIGQLIKGITEDIGIKWFVLIVIFQHLSIGFFCLTTFSNIFHETQNIKNFFIYNSIKVVGFYLLSIIILDLVIGDNLKSMIKENIEENSYKYEPEYKKKLLAMLDSFVEYVSIFVGNLLAIFNIFYDKFILGILYIFLFTTPYDIKGFKKYLFRACSIFPIVFIICSLVIRALVTTKKIKMSFYLTPLFLASKITIYGFFIITLLIIKIKSLKYNVYDEEKYISPKVFKKIATKTFLFFGVLEFLIGFFRAEWSNIGIGGKYLIILCTPIIALYDYKKKNKLTIRCFPEKDLSKCFSITFNAIGYFIIFILGTVLYYLYDAIYKEIIDQILDTISHNIDLFLSIVSKIT